MRERPVEEIKGCCSDPIEPTDASNYSDENPEGEQQESNYASVAKIEAVLKKVMATDWRRNWVIYPMPRTYEMQKMLKGQRIVLYEVTAPMDLRVARSGITDLQKFCELTSNYERSMQGDQSIPIENSF